MLSDERILILCNQLGVKVRTGAGAIKLSRAIESEVRKEMAANAEANRVDELTEMRKQDTALIQQLVEALEGMHWKDAYGKAIKSGRARLENKPTTESPDLTTLQERGAKAWKGVDAQDLREGKP